MPKKFIDKEKREYFLDNNDRLYSIIAGKKVYFQHFFIANMDKINHFYQGYICLLNKKRFIINA